MPELDLEDFRSRPNVSKVLLLDTQALKPIGYAVLDEECLRVLRKWHCRPGVYVSANIPVIFTIRG